MVPSKILISHASKNDLERVFRNISQLSSTNLHESLAPLYKMARQLIRIESKRIKLEQPESSNNNSTTNNVDGTTSMDGDISMSEANDGNSKTVETNGLDTMTSPLQNEEIRKSLFQVTPDGYVFSDMSSIPGWINEKEDSQELRK
jgi:hypothetical protein